MSFWLYRKSTSKDVCSFERVAEVRLTSPTGMLATFIKEHDEANSPVTWDLPDIELISRLVPGESPTSYALILDLLPEDVMHAQLHLLVAIRGSSDTDHTDLVLVCRPLFEGRTPELSTDFKQSFSIPLPLDQREMIEALGLSGGTTGGRYFWAQPGMNIGAAVMPSRSSFPQRIHSSTTLS